MILGGISQPFSLLANLEQDAYCRLACTVNEVEQLSSVILEQYQENYSLSQSEMTLTKLNLSAPFFKTLLKEKKGRRSP